MANVQHLVSCVIELGGDIRQTVVRGADRPVSWTEVPILQFLHTPGSVHNFSIVDTVPRPRTWDEKQRLTSIYGAEVVNTVYPGNNPNFEWLMPGEEADAEAEEAALKAAKPSRRVAVGVATE